MSWTIEPHGKGFALYSGRDDMRHGMNLVYLSEPDANWPKVKALIEAAPDLLEALERILEQSDDDWMISEWSELRKAGREAIKKARGE